MSGETNSAFRKKLLPTSVDLTGRTAALIAFKAASIAVRFALFGMLGPVLQVIRGFSGLLVLLPRLMGGVMGFGRLLLWLNMTPIKAVIGSVKLLGGLFVKLGALVGLNPIGAVMMALAGLAVLVYTHWDEISVWFSTKMEAVRAAFDQGLLQGVFKVLAEFNPFRLAVEGLQALIGKVLEMIGVPDQIVQAFTQFDLFATGADLLQSLWDGMASLVPQMVGARDQGGPVRPGLPYLVGERAPELFVPDVAGQILPARALSAQALPQIDSRPPLSAAGAGRQVIRQGDTINMTINAGPGMDAQAIAREVERALRRQQRGTSAALHDGGDYA